MREDEQNVFQRLFDVWMCTMTSNPGYFIRGFFTSNLLEFRKKRRKNMNNTTSNTTTAVTPQRSLRYTARYVTVTAMLSAVAYILMLFDFAIPIVPSFIKLDLSDLPELIGAFAMGPMCGVLICLIKNLFHLIVTTTGGVGEFSNFILGAAFVLPAGLIYKHKKTRKSALLGAILGAVFMGIFSIFSNYFIVYPVYYQIFAPEEIIVGVYDEIASTIFHTHVNGILQCLVFFNLPFTIVKGLISVAITMLIYKPLSPILKGRDN
jgi:riboflavin transporter FmnP